MENLSDTLKNEAVNLGLCAQWTADWAHNSDPQTLIEKYVKGIDFSIAHDWPSCEFIKANFDRDTLHRNLIFVDEDIDLKDAPSGIYVVNGSCTGTIRLAPWSVATIYIRHDSRISIESGAFARVFIRLYDDSDVEQFADETAIIKVYNRRNLKKKYTCPNLH